MTLSQLPAGHTAIIQKVGGEGALRLRLLDMGLIPGTKVELIKIAPLGDPLEIRLRDYELTLQKSEASCIELQEETA